MDLISTTSDLAAACDRLAQHKVITVDTEFLRETTYYPLLCVVQMASADEAVVVDALAPGIDLKPFFELMSNEAVLKVFHAARQDIEIVWHLSGTIPHPIFDTQVAAMVLGYGDSIAYDQLVDRVTGHRPDKTHRFTDWSRRPLSEEQLHYAVSDVTHLREVFAALDADLRKRDRSDWVSEEMEILTSPKTYDFHPERAWERLKTRVRKPRELAVLIEVAAWREQEAQSRDVPRSRVLKDDAVGDIATHAPTSLEKLGNLRSLPKGFERSKWGADIIAAVQRGLVKRDELHHEMPVGMQCFAMNLRRPVFADRRTREALGLVFDFEWMNANLFYNSYKRAYSYFNNTELASSGVPAGRELEILQPYRDRLPAELFTQPFKLPVTDGSGNNRDNQRRALELLRQAGWVVRDRQMVNAQGQRLSFEILLSDASFERIALPYAQSLQRLGVEANVRTIDLAQYQVRMDNFDYDMTVELFGQSNSPGNEQRDFWGSAAAKQNGSRNTLGIADPVVDALVELVVNAPDRKELVVRTHALDRVLLWNFYAVPHWYSDSFRIAWWDKFGRPPRNPRTNIGFEGWWIDPARERALSEARRSPA